MNKEEDLEFTNKIRQIKLVYDWKTLDKNFRYLVYYLRKRLRRDWDIVIALTGEEGSGKSTCAGLVGCLVDKKFNLIDNMALLPDKDQIVKEYFNLKKYQCYVIDEAIRSLYKMTFMTSVTQTLVRMWATERYQNKATILVIPRFTDLVENFRNHRVKLWIHVIARGRALVYIRDDDPHNTDPWNMNYARKIKEKYNKKKNLSLLTIEERINIEKKLPNFLFDFTFPDFSPEFKKAYQSLKVKSRDILTKEKEDKKEEPKTIQDLKIQRDGLIYSLIEKGTSQKEISKSFNLSIQKVKNALKRAKERKEKELAKRKDIENIGGIHKQLESALETEQYKKQVRG